MNKLKWIKRMGTLMALSALAVLTAGCGEGLIVLDPKGPIGSQQRDLIGITVLLCLVVILPVLVIAAVFIWRYRDKPGRKAPYTPNWVHSTKLEVIWWGIPILIIIALAGVTIKYTYALDPARPLKSEAKPITIQVTSMDWKWLFTYPDQNIATVNFVEFPEDVPIQFQLTSDGAMNSFWIPQLGGQIYTMSGMAMKLHLQADEQGEYFGSGANFTGREFAKMRFTAKATTQAEFDEWVNGIKNASPALTTMSLAELEKPGISEVQSYSSFPKGMFNQIVTKYSGAHGSMHMGSDDGTGDMTGMGDMHDAPNNDKTDSK